MVQFSQPVAILLNLYKKNLISSLFSFSLSMEKIIMANVIILNAFKVLSVGRFLDTNQSSNSNKVKGRGVRVIQK